MWKRRTILTAYCFGGCRYSTYFSDIIAHGFHLNVQCSSVHHHHQYAYHAGRTFFLLTSSELISLNEDSSPLIYTVCNFIHSFISLSSRYYRIRCTAEMSLRAMEQCDEPASSPDLPPLSHITLKWGEYMCADVKNKRTIVTVTSYATILKENVDLFPNIDVFNALCLCMGQNIWESGSTPLHTHFYMVHPEGAFKLLWNSVYEVFFKIF